MVKIFSFLLILIVWQAGFVRNMAPQTHHYEFALYMIEALYAFESECDEKVNLEVEIEWFCATFIYGQEVFEDRWMAYSSVRPSKFKLKPISPWGEVFVGKNRMGFYGRLYDVAGGRLVVGYSSDREEERLYIGFEKASDYTKLSIGKPA